MIEPGAEALSGSRRRLLCARCLAAWTYPRMVCAGCGETRSDRLPIYEEGDWIPHARVDGLRELQPLPDQRRPAP